MERFFVLLAIGLSIQIYATMTMSVTTKALKSRSGFGESCNKTIKCKTQSRLICSPETFQCDCAKPDQMIYDDDKEKCVMMIGEQCKYSFESDDESIRLFHETIDCVNGAICGKDDVICVCPPDSTYEDVVNNKCAPVKPHGAKCEHSTECGRMLICKGGECVCDEDKRFDHTTAECNIKAGEKCGPSGASEPNIISKSWSRSIANCINGSECNLNSGICTCGSGMYMDSGICIKYRKVGTSCLRKENESNTTAESETGTTLSDGAVRCIRNGFCNHKLVCACNDGYSETSDGFCGLAYNQRCSSDNVCSDEFSCKHYQLNNVTSCRCPSELQVYVDNACKGVVGFLCEQKTGCVKNAQCVRADYDYNGYLRSQQSICECEEGFIEFDAENCDIAYGSKCEPSGIVGKAHCDRISGLVCTKASNDTDFRCSCPNAIDMFERSRRKCIRGGGFRCEVDDDCITNKSCSRKNKGDPSGRCSY